MKGGSSGTSGWSVWPAQGRNPSNAEFENGITRVDGDEPAHQHYSALYRVVDVNTQFMVDKPLARPCKTPLFRPDYVIKGEVVVTDINRRPVENLRVCWTGTPNAPQYMYDVDGNLLQPDAGKYFTMTDAAGQAIVYLGNPEPTIVSFQLDLENGYRACTPIVFSNLVMGDSITKSAWQAPLPAGRLPVNLDSPSETVPIVLPSAVRASKTVAQIAVVLNGAAALVGYPTQTIDDNNIVQLPKKYFVGNGQSNHIGFITIDPTGRGAESYLVDFVATGGGLWWPRRGRATCLLLMSCPRTRSSILPPQPLVLITVVCGPPLRTAENAIREKSNRVRIDRMRLKSRAFSARWKQPGVFARANQILDIFFSELHLERTCPM